MFGAIIGDFIGSRFEFEPIYNKNFSFFTQENVFTDDSILTSAVARSFLYNESLFFNTLEFTNKYPKSGFGRHYSEWIRALNMFVYEQDLYNTGVKLDENDNYLDSWGNGCLMKNSPAIILAKDLKDAQNKAFAHTNITHRHKTSFFYVNLFTQACFSVLQLACKNNLSVEQRKNIFFDFFAKNNISFDKIDNYLMNGFFDDAENTTPRVLACLYEAQNFEEVIRNAIFIGGDCDTNACIAGYCAEIIYGLDKDMLKDFIAYSKNDLEKYFDIVPIVAAQYLYSPSKQYFFNQDFYLPVIETILAEQKSYLNQKNI